MPISAEIQGIIERLERNDPSLTYLNLPRKEISDEAATALAKALKVNRTLTSVDLGANSIGVEGANAWAEMLKVNRTLTSVDLRSNSIGVEGAKAWAELKVNPTSTWVYLVSRSVGDEGAKALADALEANRTLKQLYLADNRIEEATLSRINTLLKRNQALAQTQAAEHTDEADSAVEKKATPLPPSSPQLAESESEEEKEESDIAPKIPQNVDLMRAQLDLLQQTVSELRKSQRVQTIAQVSSDGNIQNAVRLFSRFMQERSAALEHALQSSEQVLLRHHEQLFIMVNPKLDVYYQYFIQVVCSMLAISTLMRDSSVTNITEDAIGKGLRYAHSASETAEHVVKKSAQIFRVTLSVPVVSETLQVMRNIYEFKEALERKREAILITRFFHATTSRDEFIELLARQLVLFQAERLVALTAESAGIKKQAQRMAARVLRNDVAYEVPEEEVPLREAALEDAVRFAEIIFGGSLGDQKRLSDVHQVFRAVIEKRYKKEDIKDGPEPIYVSPFAALLEQASAAQEALSEEQELQISQDDLEDLRSRVASIQENLVRTSAELTAEKTRAGSHVQELQGQVRKLELSLAVAQEKVEKAAEQLAKQVSQANRNAQGQIQQLQEAQVSFEQLQRRAYEEFQKDQKTVEMQLREMQQELSQLKSESASASDHAALKATIQAMSAKVQKMQEALSKHQPDTSDAAGDQAMLQLCANLSPEAERKILEVNKDLRKLSAQMAEFGFHLHQVLDRFEKLEERQGYEALRFDDLRHRQRSTDNEVTRLQAELRMVTEQLRLVSSEQALLRESQREYATAQAESSVRLFANANSRSNNPCKKISAMCVVL